MNFPWSRERKREELLAQPCSEEWLRCVEANFFHYGTLARVEQERLIGDMRILAAEKIWEGAGGLSVTDEMVVTIAAQAALLVIGLDHDYYSNVETVLIYPSSYVAKNRTSGPGGIVVEQKSARLGESWSQGPVVLSWADALSGGRNGSDGHNVVLHEFAHKLDLRNGGVDGVPLLHDAAQYDVWSEVMTQEYAELVASAESGHSALLDYYGATNAAEFFAVATECFFEKARPMKHSHERLYNVLRDFYKQDPAERDITGAVPRSLS